MARKNVMFRDGSKLSCSHSITASFEMPENHDLMTNVVKYAVSQEPVIVVVSKPLKKNNSRQGEPILFEKNSN